MTEQLVQKEMVTDKEAKSMATNFESQSGDIFVKVNAMQFIGCPQTKISASYFMRKYKELIEEKGHPIAIVIDTKNETISLIHAEGDEDGN